MSLPTPKKKNCTAAAACMRGTAADFFTRCAIAAADVHVELSKVVSKLLMGLCMAIVRPCKALGGSWASRHGRPWKALGRPWKALEGLVRPWSHGRHRACRKVMMDVGLPIRARHTAYKQAHWLASFHELAGSQAQDSA